MTSHQSGISYLSSLCVWTKIPNHIRLKREFQIPPLLNHFRFHGTFQEPSFGQLIWTAFGKWSANVLDSLRLPRLLIGTFLCNSPENFYKTRCFCLGELEDQP